MDTAHLVLHIVDLKVVRAGIYSSNAGSTRRYLNDEILVDMFQAPGKTWMEAVDRILAELTWRISCGDKNASGIVSMLAQRDRVVELSQMSQEDLWRIARC